MLKWFTTLPILLLGLSAMAQPLFPFATQSEVNAGVVANKFVSPKTLAGWSGSGAASGLTNAIAFGELTRGSTNNVLFGTVSPHYAVSGVSTNVTLDATAGTITALANGAYLMMFRCTYFFSPNPTNPSAIFSLSMAGSALSYTNTFTSSTNDLGEKYFYAARLGYLTSNSSVVATIGGDQSDAPVKVLDATLTLMRVNGSGSGGGGGAAGGETNWVGEASVTNSTRMGLVFGKAGNTNTLRSLQAGANVTLTNQGTNIMIAFPPWQSVSFANITASNGTVYLERDGGGNSVTMTAPLNVASSYTIRLPDGIGTAGYLLANDGLGQWYWVDPNSVGGGGSGTTETQYYFAPEAFVTNSAGYVTTAPFIPLTNAFLYGDSTFFVEGFTVAGFMDNLGWFHNTGGMTNDGYAKFGNVVEAEAVTVNVSLFLAGEVHQAGGILMTNQLGLQERDGGAHRVNIKAPLTMAADWGMALPTTNGIAGQTMVNDGSGNLSWGSTGATNGQAVVAASSLVTGRVLSTNEAHAPIAGIIGGLGGAQTNVNFRTNLTANAMLIISNLQYITEVEVVAAGPIATISNALSINWMEGSPPIISTNGRTKFRVWMFAGTTNGNLVAGQLTTLTNGNGIELTQDPVNNTASFAISNAVLTQISAGSRGPFYVVEEDFIGGNTTSGQIGKHGWSSSGTAGTVTSQTTSPGIYQLTTSTALTNHSAIHLGSSTAVIAGLTNSFYTNDWYGLMPGTSYYTNQTLFMGISDTVTANELLPTAGAAFVCTNLASPTPANWMAITFTAGTATVVDTGISSGTVAKVKFTIRCTANGRIDFLINDVVVSSQQAGGPSSGGRLYARLTKNEATVDTDAALYNIDRVTFAIPRVD